MSVWESIEQRLTRYDCAEAVLRFDFTDGSSVDVYRSSESGVSDDQTEVASKEIYRLLRTAEGEA